MSQLQAIARLKIRDGRLEEFKQLAVKCMELVRTRDSGTLQYDWFFSGDHIRRALLLAVSVDLDLLEVVCARATHP